MTDVYVVMKQTSGTGPDSQWFDYKAGFFSPIIRVEWDLGTMHIVVDQTTADMLIRNGHARLMTSQEREEYTLSTEKSDPTKEVKP